MTRQSSFILTGWNCETEFRCLQCDGFISAYPRLSGVQNRNHCPYCLWSRHMDLHHPGDRLAACRAKMQPVGLTLKAVRKKYRSSTQGELMLVHVCAECGKVSINRIAADDDPHTILKVLEEPGHLDSYKRQQLVINSIQILRPSDQQIVMAGLLGRIQPGWAG